MPRPAWRAQRPRARKRRGRPRLCAACHARGECLDCHRPDPVGAPAGYHPAGFIAAHPAQAYQRESSCSDCHNPRPFCSSCQATAGLAAIDAPLDAGYHDAKRFFLAGHGQAARQNLESCASCHAERDCMTCHATSIEGGRNFNPHGPGFDAERLRRRNPQMCTACHGSAILFADVEPLQSCNRGTRVEWAYRIHAAGLSAPAAVCYASPVDRTIEAAVDAILDGPIVPLNAVEAQPERSANRAG